MSSLDDLTRLLRLRAGLPEPARRKEIRVAAGATLQDVAGVVGVSLQAVALWESGKRTPRGRNRENYVTVLHHLLGVTDVPNVGSYSQQFRLPGREGL